eukprot:8532138-Ditylum_brightwellii.AAC.1
MVCEVVIGDVVWCRVSGCAAWGGLCAHVYVGVCWHWARCVVVLGSIHLHCQKLCQTASGRCQSPGLTGPWQ